MIDITKLHGITGKITQEDIDQGVQCDHQHCAVARTVERMIPGYDIFVDDYVAVSEPKGEIITEMAITEQLLEWIDKFDNKKQVEPIPLVIYKNNMSMRDWILCMGEDDDRIPC